MECDGRFLDKLFRNSKLLNGMNKILMYYNLPWDHVVEPKVVPVQIFPKEGSEDKLPQTYQIVDFFERKRAFSLGNLILMECEVPTSSHTIEKVIVGGYSSHGWIREGVNQSLVMK